MGRQDSASLESHACERDGEFGSDRLRHRKGERLKEHMLGLCADQAPQLCADGIARKCEFTRITEDDNLLSNSGFNKALAAAARPGTRVMVSLPRTGGTPWAHANKRLEHASNLVTDERLEFKRLLKRARKMCRVAMDHGGWATLKLPRCNRYWNSRLCPSIHSWA